MMRVLAVTGILLALLMAVVIGGFFGLGLYLSPQDPLAKADAIVAISGGETDARTDEAVRLYRDGWARHIIFSGAALDPNGPSNARAMANRAESQGIPPSVVSLDEMSTNTRENAANVTKIVKHLGDHSIILVTSPYHQRRADIVFKRALGPGYSLINHSSYDQNWRRSHWWATTYSRDLTVSESQKVVYELLNGQSQ